MELYVFTRNAKVLIMMRFGCIRKFKHVAEFMGELFVGTLLYVTMWCLTCSV